MSVKPIKITVGKGKTVRPGEQEEWVREYYEIEIALADPSEMETARANALGTIDAWLSEAIKAEKVRAAVPDLDLPELEKLPWKSYRTKEACKEGEPGWIFADHRAPEGSGELIKAVRASGGGKLDLGSYDYSFSGADKQFLSRRPLKKKEKES